MVLIFHSFKDLEDFWNDLHVSLPDGSLQDDFQEAFQTTSRKPSRRLPGKSSELPVSRLDFLEVVWTSWKSSDEVFFHIKWSQSLSL
ncbi:hypothetical protein Bca4012_082485 [Brassica carinata]